VARQFKREHDETAYAVAEKARQAKLAQFESSSLTRCFAKEPSLILGDRVQLQQVLINLIMNGLQSMASVTGKRELIVQSCVDPKAMLSWL
jgi:C4-dicarboxylate-specific signal transduction histidine kinase